MPRKRQAPKRASSSTKSRSTKRARPGSRARKTAPAVRRTRPIRASLQGGSTLPRFLQLPNAIPLTWLKFIIGLILAPICWVTTEATLASFARVTLQTSFWRSPEFWFFNIGSLMWLIAFFGAKGRPLLFLYVLGHECTHAFFALLCGARVERVRVSSSGGHILTDKNNVLISLSPYFVPFYTVLLLAAYAIAGNFLEFGDTHYRVLFALIGVTWTFHLTFTVWMILKNQPDLRQNGTFFSLTLIYLINMLLIVGMLVIASPALAWRNFTTTWLTHAYTFPTRITESVRELLEVL